MRSFWRRRSFKLRLTLWYTGVIAVVLGVLGIAAYEIVEHRLAAELDRQLRIDFDFVEGQVERDSAGRVSWPLTGAHGDEGFVRLAAWFEVWSERGELLLRRWPVADSEITSPLPAPAGGTLRFYETELEGGLPVRIMERPARIGDRGVVMRMFRDESDMRRTLREIVDVFLLALPFAVLGASFGGYFVALRSLRPVTEMARQAERITSESLAARLPNPNPADEFGQLATVFNETLQRLQSSFEELQRFTADASHELRTPLTALRAVGELAIKRGASPAELRETILSMLEEAERLDALIESLLTMARLERGESAPCSERVRALDLCREIGDTLAVLAQERQQTLTIHGDPDTAALADRLLLRQALMNVTHNAIRNAPAGTDIDIGVESAQGRVAFSVSDQGPGIAPENRKKIFERFFRVDPARPRAGGFGLGLAIAKRSIERQGGNIEVESEVGRGSTFRIVLPAAAAARDP